MPLDLESEQFPASGGTAAAGVLNQLGRPSADRLTLLVREAVQNSWDARIPDGRVVNFQIDGYVLDSAQKARLLEDVFAYDAPGLELRARLASDQELHVLALSDTGTLGLGGPTRSDVVPAAGEPTHFVDLLRNLGRPNDRQFSGGTFGFGKAAAYLASELSTIAVFSRHRTATGLQERFIAAALGNQFETTGPHGKRHTGRHWWGRKSNGDSVAEPCTGDEALRLATLFGAPPRDTQATGTTIFVLAPIFERLDPFQAMERVAQALTYYFWPKLVDGASGTPTMSFAVRWRGQEVQLPNVRTEPNLALMVSAFEAASRGGAPNARVEPVQSYKPKRHLGTAGFVQRFTQPAQSGQDALQDEEGTFLAPVVLEAPMQHIAVMRQPHFVVKYMKGPGVSWAQTEYAGVFIADSQLDSVFAESEPPTHDDWVPDLLKNPADKSAVRIAHARLKALMESFAAPESLEAPPYVEQSVAEFAQMLGGLIPAVEPPGNRHSRGRHGDGGADGGTSRGGDGSSRNVARTSNQLQLEIEGRPEVDIVEGHRCMRVTFRLSGPLGTSGLVSAVPRVVLLDGMERDPPAGADIPTVLSWRAQDGTIVGGSKDSCVLPIVDASYSVEVSVPRDAMVSVSLDVSEAVQ